MPDLLMGSLYDTATDAVISTVSTPAFLMCTLASIILGAVVAAIYMYKHKYSKNFVVTIALLPIIVQTVITLVNGNLGAGVAVMGVFSLVRFRSIPGSAKDIGTVFLAMAVGLATGMGYIGLAVLCTVILAIVNLVYVNTSFGQPKQPEKRLKITVPEDLDFEGVFDETLERYASSYELASVSTSNMGSLYMLDYLITMKEGGTDKQLIDELRCLNGNCKIVLGRAATGKETL